MTSTFTPHSNPTARSIWSASSSTPWPFPTPRRRHLSQSHITTTSHPRRRLSLSVLFRSLRKHHEIHFKSSSTLDLTVSFPSLNNHPGGIERQPVTHRHPSLLQAESEWKQHARHLEGDYGNCLSRAECLSIGPSTWDVCGCPRKERS